MASSVRLRLGDGDFDLEPMRIHALPCKIHHTGPAPVDQYFVVSKEEEAEAQAQAEAQAGSVLVSSLRGRRLLGREEKLPQGAVGLVIATDLIGGGEEGEEGEEGEDGEPTREVRVEANFDSITYWKQDAVPRRDESAVPAWMDFIRLSRVLHKS